MLNFSLDIFERDVIYGLLVEMVLCVFFMQAYLAYGTHSNTKSNSILKVKHVQLIFLSFHSH